eukprot:scpid50336/ scgid10800/ 
MDENPVPGCEFCSEQRPSLTCSDCSLSLCETCCSLVHSKGKLAEHKLTPYSCEVCSKTRSEVDCFNCDVGFCAPCFNKLHSRGTMALHVRSPREPVDPSRQSALDGLPGQLPPQLGTVPNTADPAAASAAAVLSSVAQQSRAWSSPSSAPPATTAGPSSSIFCDGTCKTCPPASSKPGYGLPRAKKEKGEDGEGSGDEKDGEDQPPMQPPRILEPVNLALLPCQHRVNQRLFSYRKTGDGWVGREVVGNIFTDCNSQSQLQFEVREDGIFCNICPPHRAPFSTSGDVSNLRSHAKSDLHLNHLTLRMTGQWPSCKPTGILSDGSFVASPSRKANSGSPVCVTPAAEVFTPSHGNKGFRSPKQHYTPQEQELLMQLGVECNWSKRNNAQIEKFAEEHNMLPRRVKAWIGNHKPTRKKYRYSSGSSSSQPTPSTSNGTVATLAGMSQPPAFSVASSAADGVTSYSVSSAIALSGGQSTATVTLLPQLPIPGEVVLPESS